MLDLKVFYDPRRTKKDKYITSMKLICSKSGLVTGALAEVVPEPSLFKIIFPTCYTLSWSS